MRTTHLNGGPPPVDVDPADHLEWLIDRLASGPEGDRLAYPVTEAARIIGVHRDTVYALMNSGQLEGRKLGGRTVIRRQAIAAYLESLPLYQPKAAS